MTGTSPDFWTAVRAATRQLLIAHGVACPECRRLHPRAEPSILLPGARCRVDGYRDRRPVLTREQIEEAGR
jgi:hypothetical protein